MTTDEHVTKVIEEKATQDTINGIFLEVYKPEEILLTLNKMYNSNPYSIVSQPEVGLRVQEPFEDYNVEDLIDLIRCNIDSRILEYKELIELVKSSIETTSLKSMGWDYDERLHGW